MSCQHHEQHQVLLEPLQNKDISNLNLKGRSAKVMRLHSTSPLATGLLGGLTLQDAISQRTLFYQDYYTVLGKEIAPQVFGCKHISIYVSCHSTHVPQGVI